VRSRCQNFSSPGFTLLEVLIAVAILGTAIVVLLLQFSVALRAGSITQNVTVAVLHAREKIEELKMERELSESSQSGTFSDGIIPEDEQIYADLKVETYQLSSVVKWKDGERIKQVLLTTLKTVRKKAWKEDRSLL
jgi:prepilin-type N-terminal cleavage/methylation domain-containing protein